MAPTPCSTQRSIRDWPAMKYRGLDDDLSRGPVTTLEFEKKMIRTLAAYKINLYSPYFEHTAEYASNPLIAPPGGGISAADAAALVAYARPYHITIVPEQEAFGHLHNALIWEQYRRWRKRRTAQCSRPVSPARSRSSSRSSPSSRPSIQDRFCTSARTKPSTSAWARPRPTSTRAASAPVYLDFMQQIVTALAAAPSQAALLGRHRAGLARPAEGAAAELQGLHHRRRLGLQPRAERLRKVTDAVHRRGLRDLGLAQRAQLPRGLSRLQPRA